MRSALQSSAGQTIGYRTVSTTVSRVQLTVIGAVWSRIASFLQGQSLQLVKLLDPQSGVNNCTKHRIHLRTFQTLNFKDKFDGMPTARA